MSKDILISKNPCDPKLQFNHVPYSYGESVKKVVSDYTAFMYMGELIEFWESWYLNTLSKFLCIYYCYGKSV